jgi:5-bromo-4-chloroindolyl phosphate hydrolysis protein
MRKFFLSLAHWLIKVFSRPDRPLLEAPQSNATRDLREEKEDEIKRYRSKITVLSTRIEQVSNAIVRRQLRSITKLLDEILTYIEHDEEKLTVSKQVFVYHIDSLRSILDKYIKLSQNSDDVNELIQFFEEIKPSFEMSIDFLTEFFQKMKEEEIDSMKLEINFFKQLQL